jgi:hypothetical protein
MLLLFPKNMLQIAITVFGNYGIFAPSENACIVFYPIKTYQEQSLLLTIVR